MGKAAGRRKHQLEYARIIGANDEADTRCIYIYDRAQDCLSCDQGQPNEVEQRLSWRIVPQEEVQS